MARTLDFAKVGTIDYRVEITEHGEDDMWYGPSFADTDEVLARAWGLAMLRNLQRGNADYQNHSPDPTFTAWLTRFRWVEDEPFEDDTYGLVYDASVERDEAFNSHCDGVTWRDDHEPGGPQWEA